MRKKVLSVLLAAAVCAQLVGCGGTNSGSSDSAGGDDSAAVEADTQAEDGGSDEAPAAAEGSSDELVDGKFAETKHITVEVYDRGNDGGTDPTNNMYTKYIQDGMLADYNVEVEFKAVP